MERAGREAGGSGNELCSLPSSANLLWLLLSRPLILPSPLPPWPPGKMRNRRYVLRKGPLVIFGSDDGISKAFRNLPGVEVTSVDRLNLLQVRRRKALHLVLCWAFSAASHEE